MVKTLLSKAYSIKEIKSTIKVCDVCLFVDVVNYYRDMWRKYAHILDPLTKLRSTF